MLPRTRGGDRARTTSLLALISISCLVGAGCHHAPTLPVARRFVRLDALLSLHPAWSQVTQLDQVAARFPAAQSQTASLQWKVTPLPAPFTPPAALPQNLVAERERRLQADAARYFAQFSQSLASRREDLYRRAVREEQKRLDALVIKAIADKEALLRAQNEVRALALQRDIDRLGFRDAALQSQINVYTDFNAQQLFQDATVQDNQIRSRIADLTTQRTNVLAEDVRPRAERESAADIQKLKDESAARLEARKTQLDERVQQRIAQERDRLKQETEPIPPLGSATPPVANPRSTPLTLPPAPAAAADFRPVQAAVDTALDRQRAAWAARKAALMTAIREDTQQAVEQIARREGWHLVPEGTRGAQDWTEEVRAPLRAQWRQGTPP